MNIFFRQLKTEYTIIHDLGEQSPPLFLEDTIFTDGLSSCMLDVIFYGKTTLHKNSKMSYSFQTHLVRMLKTPLETAKKIINISIHSQTNNGSIKNVALKDMNLEN